MPRNTDQNNYRTIWRKESQCSLCAGGNFWNVSLSFWCMEMGVRCGEKLITGWSSSQVEYSTGALNYPCIPHVTHTVIREPSIRICFGKHSSWEFNFPLFYCLQCLLWRPVKWWNKKKLKVCSVDWKLQKMQDL